MDSVRPSVWDKYLPYKRYVTSKTIVLRRFSVVFDPEPSDAGTPMVQFSGHYQPNLSLWPCLSR